MKKMITKLSFVILMITLLIANLHAADIISVKSGNWTDASTWNGGVVPDTIDNVTIAAGHIVSYSVGGNTDFAMTDLTVNGTLQASSSAQQLRAFIFGKIECNGTINDANQKYGLLTIFKGKTASIGGTGSMSIRNVNLSSDTTICNISIPSLDLKEGGMSIQAVGSKIVIASGTTVTIANANKKGYLSAAANGGQGTGLSHIDISGKVSCEYLYLCNNVEEGTGKSTINVKDGGVLSVSQAFNVMRTAGGPNGTQGGSGVILTVESGAALNWSAPAQDPRLLMNPENDPYDPNVEVIFEEGSFINDAVNIASVKSGDWNDPDTWNKGEVPGVGKNVTIQSGHIVSYLIDHSGDKDISVDLCSDLTVNGTLVTSNAGTKQLNFSIFGNLDCDGSIEPAEGAKVFTAITFKGVNQTLSGSGSVTLRMLTINSTNNDLTISVSNLNCANYIYTMSNNSKMIISSGTTVDVSNGTMSLAQHAGQGKGIGTIEIYGKVNVGTVLMANNSTDELKSAINVKSGGELNVSASFTTVRGAGLDPIGGSGAVLTIENGGHLNWTSPAKDPRLLMDDQDDSYDPNIEVYFNNGSWINGEETFPTGVVNTPVNTSIRFHAIDSVIELPADMKSLSIFNVLGNAVLQISNPSTSVSIPAFPQGIYVISVIDNLSAKHNLKVLL